MAYKDNVTALARKLGISNDPGLREEDLHIEQLSFLRDDGRVTSILGSAMNRGGRLFFQARAMTAEGEVDAVPMKCNVALRQAAAEYFAELWEPNPVRGKRKLLDAIRNPHNIEVTLFQKVRSPEIDTARLVAFFRREANRWQECAEDQGIFAAAGNTNASMICGDIAEKLTGGNTEPAKRYVRLLKIHEPHRSDEADIMLDLLGESE